MPFNDFSWWVLFGGRCGTQFAEFINKGGWWWRLLHFIHVTCLLLDIKMFDNRTIFFTVCIMTSHVTLVRVKKNPLYGKVNNGFYSATNLELMGNRPLRQIWLVSARHFPTLIHFILRGGRIIFCFFSFSHIFFWYHWIKIAFTSSCLVETQKCSTKSKSF